MIAGRNLLGIPFVNSGYLNYSGHMRVYGWLREIFICSLLGCIILLCFVSACRADDLPNFRSLHPYLFCGGSPSEAGLVKLKEKGVTTVINLRKMKRSIESEKLLCQKLGISYLGLPMAHDGPTRAQVDSFLKEARLAKASYNPETKKASHAIYLHCTFGEDRTGCLIGIYRMVEDGWSQADALNEMHKYGFSLHRRGLWEVFDSYSVKDAAK